jgi:hypothetical protein
MQCCDNIVLQCCGLAVLQSKNSDAGKMKLEVGGGRWKAREMLNVKVQNPNDK